MFFLFYLVINYYFVEKNFIWWFWDLNFVKMLCCGYYIIFYFMGNNFILLFLSIYIFNIMCFVVIFKMEEIIKILI